MHKHHIIPRHAGGTDDSSNLVELTIKEHAEAHRILFEQYGRWQDEIAWKALAGMITHEEAVKEAQSRGNRGKIVSENTKESMKKAWKTRPTATEETRQKNRDALARRRKRGDKNIVGGNTGKKQSDHQRKTVSKYWTGRKRSPEQIELMRTNAKAQWARRKMGVINENNQCQ